MTLQERVNLATVYPLYTACTVHVQFINENIHLEMYLYRNKYRYTIPPLLTYICIVFVKDCLFTPSLNKSVRNCIRKAHIQFLAEVERRVLNFEAPESKTARIGKNVALLFT